MKEGRKQARKEEVRKRGEKEIKSLKIISVEAYCSLFRSIKITLTQQNYSQRNENKDIEASFAEDPSPDADYRSDD